MLPLRATLLFVILQLTPVVYYPSSIDSVWESTHAAVQLTGTVAGMHLDVETSTFHVRLEDAHGHSLTCVWPKSLAAPALKVEILVYGTRKIYPLAVRGQGVQDLLVDKFEPVE